MKIKRQSIQEAREGMIRELTIRCCFYAMLLVLNGLEGFGKKKMTRVYKEFQQTLWDYRNRYDEAMLDALERDVKARGVEVNWV
jgi:hypothetical protein